MASDMSSLMDLVSQNQPRFQTHQALLVIGMQNDFIQPDGRLPVNTQTGYLERIQTLIPKFRELNGNVIWVQTLYEADRIANDANTGEGDALVVGGLIDGDESSTEGGEEEAPKDLPPEKSRSSKHKKRALDLLKRVSARRKTIPQEVARATAEQDDELFLLKSEKKAPACVPHTHGAQFADIIARLFQLPADMVIRTTNYSAFQGTSLLMTLRAKLVTEVYICGNITNVSVLATVIDAARHGVKINVIEDCLGYRKQARHDLALKRMDEFFDAYLVNSADIMTREVPEGARKKSTSPNGSKKSSQSNDRALEAMVGKLSLNEPDARPSSRPQSVRSPTKVLTGGPRKLSLVSVAQSRKSLGSSAPAEPVPEPTDEQFTDKLVQGAKVVQSESAPIDTKDETKFVTKKIRMRSKGKKKKKKEETEGDASNEKSDATAVVEKEAAKTTMPESQVVEPVTPATAAKVSTRPPASSPRTSMLAKAESVLNLRDRTRQQALKSVASQPVLASKADNKEKEKDRESWSDRMRSSLSRASVVSTKAPSMNSKVESRPESMISKPAERPITPARIPEPVSQEPSTPKEKPASKEVTAHDGSTRKDAPVPEQAAAKEIAPKESPAASAKMPTAGKGSKVQSLANLPALGPEDTIAEGDSRIIYNFFPSDLTHPSNTSKPLHELIFTQLYNEVRWQKMMHQQGEVPRLVCCQGEFGGDGSMPIYRHPTDQTLPLLHFSPKVQVIRKQAEKLAGHPLNHVLIQMYRSGNDYISEHSDKTLDIVKGSSIVNVSFGAQRTMRLRTKKASKSNDDKSEDDTQRTTQRVHMPHNSIFVLGLKTNEKWLHGIMADKRSSSERSAAETAYNGIRISLTFRHIGTYLDARESIIWGQGATAKDQRDAADVINDDADEAERLIRAFSRENHDASFDWDACYGEGFDLVHINNPPEDISILFASNNAIETAQVQIGLAEAKIRYTLMEAPTLERDFEIDRQVVFRDNDAHHTETIMSASILIYLDRYHVFDRDERSRPCTANGYQILILAAGLLKAWNNRAVATYMEEFERLLGLLEERLATDGGPFIAGKRFCFADCYVWPILEEVVQTWDAWDEGVYVKLGEYVKGTARKKASVKKIREEWEKRKEGVQATKGDELKVKTKE